LGFLSTIFTDPIKRVLFKPVLKVDFGELGTYLFTIQVIASGTNPVIIKISFTWNGNWDNFEAKKYDN